MRTLKTRPEERMVPLRLALLLCGPAPAAAMVEPSWTAEIRTHGRECFDASQQHKPPDAPPWLPGVQNNTRWTHWAVPEGTPPPQGWPVIVTFEVMGFWPLVGDNSTCGDGWHHSYGPPPPPPSAACRQVVEDVVRNCTTARATGNHTVCQRCEYRARAEAMRLHHVNESTPCKMQELEKFCPPAPPKPWQKHHSEHGQHSSIHPFAKPDDVLAPEFAQNGSWSGPPSGGDGGFDAHAGLLWLQRVRQYTVANGIAWIILNPYMGDSWDWDTVRSRPITDQNAPHRWRSCRLPSSSPLAP